MNIVGITLNNALDGYVEINALKISKWVDPEKGTLDVIFRLTIEHKYGEEGFKKIEEFYMYFREEDIEDITIESNTIRQQRKRLEKSEKEGTEERSLEREINPLGEYIHPIHTKNVTIENIDDKKRIKVYLEDYEITENTKKRNIFFSVKSKRSIDFIDGETSWSYNCMVEPYLIQTLKWSNEEFMPLLKSLQIWLQIPKIYPFLSDVDIRPVDHLEQLFFLGKDYAGKFQKAEQPLALEDTLCINWNFSQVSVSSPPEEITATFKPRPHKREENFIKRFEEDPEDSFVTLREMLYECRVWALDLKYIISKTSNKHLKDLLEIFNTMIFHRFYRPMKENLDTLLSPLKNFRNFPHYDEFYRRYDIFYTLITCDKSDGFFSNEITSKFKDFQKLKELIDPDYRELIGDLETLSETTRKFNLYNLEDDKPRYKNEAISEIDRLNEKWMKRLIYPDRYIFIDILTNWWNIIEREFEEVVPHPQIKAGIKTKHVTYADEVGIVFSVENSGRGNAKDIYVKLLSADDYSIITRISEVKALLAGGGRSFEPELVVKPKNKKGILVQYEIHYKDILSREKTEKYRECIEFIRKEIEFKKIENPYIIGDAVRDKRMFFDREDVFSTIIENFKGKYQINPIFLYGQRKTGKTSILYHLKERLREDFSPVYFSMSEISEGKSFYQDLMEKIKDELDFSDIEIPSIEGDALDTFKNGFYAKIMERSGGKRLVLMIDEYQSIDQHIIDGRYEDSVIDFLNALVQDGEIKFILAGFLRPEELQNTRWIELMRFFTTVNVSFLSREDTVRLICEPVRDSVEFDEGALEKIISLSGCHPCFTQLICHVMVEHHNRDMLNIIGYNDVINKLFDYFERGHNVFTDVFMYQTDEVERMVLFLLCNLLEMKREISIHRFDIELMSLEREKSVSRADIGKALSRLERKEIIRKSTEHPEYYEFAIDLYRHWVKWNMRQDDGGK